MLMNEQLTINQWQTSCTKLDYLVQQISEKIQETCSALLLPTLTHRTNQQGGFLPRKLQKHWKKQLSTYHLIRKTIHITKTIPLWQNHPIIEELRNHKHTTIPPPPHLDTNPQEWIKTIAEIAKTANKQARKITTKYTQECVKKAITKYRQLYEKNPKKINNKVFKNQDTPP